MKKKIYPYLIREQQISGYYEILLDQNYSVKIFDKVKDRKIYETLLPHIKDFMFWTFNISSINSGEVNKREFSKMSNDLKAVICGKYPCNIFEKEENIIVCFKSGICFIITENEEEAKKIKKFESELQMKSINLRDDSFYEIPNKSEEDEVYMYLYILELYKMIFMNKVHKELQDTNMFDKARNDYVKFIEKVYNTKITDNNNYNNQCQKWDKELELDETYLKIDNEFDLVYRNNKMNEDKTAKAWCIVLIIIAIIIGIINLWGMMR